MQKIWAGKILSHALNKLVNGLGLGVMAVAKQGWKEADSIWFYKSTAQSLSSSFNNSNRRLRQESGQHNPGSRH